MRVIVTGGSGFIGSHIVDVLIEQGHSVTNLDIKPAHRQDVKYVNGSILNRKLIDSLIKTNEVVYHIGGFSNINFVKKNPVETIELNVLSTTYLIDACRRYGKPHFIYASSVYAFDRNGHLYTSSKAFSERIIEDFSLLYNIPYTILRYGTVYGPRNREADVIYLFLEKAIKGEPIEIHGDGSQKRNFIYVRDLAEGSVKVIENEKAVNKTLVIADNRSVRIKELAYKIKEIVNPGIQLKFIGEKREKDYEGIVKDIENSQNILGWTPRVKVEDWIRTSLPDVKKKNNIVC